MRAFFLAVLAYGTLASCAAQAPSPATSLRVLFIGNSLTGTNELPAIVEELARADGAVSLETASVVYPALSLDDHLAQGDAASRIAEGGWDFVVLQQGPSGLPASRTALIASTRQFAALCAPVKARVALYSVWPASDRPTAFDSVTASYAAAAAAVGGRLLPAGRAWQLAWQHDPSLPLYGPDGFHPSPYGSYLAALVIYQGLTRRSAVGLPAGLTVDGVQVNIPQGQAAVMQAAAEESLRPSWNLPSVR
jgi:hypothetical protein